MTYFAEYKTDREYHYYLAGRAIGLPLIILEGIGLLKLLLEVLR
jgi:hypothetical protein